MIVCVVYDPTKGVLGVFDNYSTAKKLKEREIEKQEHAGATYTHVEISSVLVLSSLD